MPFPPALSDEQRRDALAKAAVVRKQRAGVKESLKNGGVSLQELFGRTGDDVVGKMKVANVLESLPGVGKVRAQRIIERLDISASRRMRGLGAKQREGLLREFEEK
jgi:hypothetical protein